MELVTVVWLSFFVLIISLSRESSASPFSDPKVWCDILPEEQQLKFKPCVDLKAQEKAQEQSNTIADPMTNSNVFEGDILGFDVDRDVDPNVVNEKALEGFKNAIRDEKKRWPDGVVPYRISPGFKEKDRQAIITAMDVFQKNTCVRFRPVNKTDTDYINILPAIGCNSYTGRQSRKQDLSLQVDGCMVPGVIQHELMHALGFFHEQSRTDRDEFVDVNWDNINRGDWSQFQKYSDEKITAFGYDYDFGSVLHYKMYDFAIDPKVWTIRPKAKYQSQASALKMGQREGLSPTDIKKIIAMYQCSESSPCPPGNAWKLFDGKCFYFSFLAGEQRKDWVGARNFCRQKWSALLASPSKSLISKLIKPTMKENSKLITDDEEMWLNSMKSVKIFSDEAEDNDIKAELHFVCARKYSDSKSKTLQAV